MNNCIACCHPEPVEGRNVGGLAYSFLFSCCLFKEFHIPPFDRLRMTVCYGMFQKTSLRVSASPFLCGENLPLYLNTQKDKTEIIIVDSCPPYKLKNNS